MMMAPTCSTTSITEPNPLLLPDRPVRRRRSTTVTTTRSLSAFCMIQVLLLILARTSEAFQPTSTSTSPSIFTKSLFIPTRLLVSKDYTQRDEALTQKKAWSSSTTSSWSKPSGGDADADTDNGGNSSSSSRFGVRKRVKAVLEKAKIRTGLSNRNSDASVIAEAASIGGLYESADLVVRTRNGYINGYTNGAASAQATNNAAASVSVEQALREVQGRGPLRNGTDVDLVLESSVANERPSTRHLEVDAVLNSGTVEALPFKLPELSAAQRDLLATGERVQEQSKMGREGSGFVVLDVKAPDYVVWECLLDFEKYPDYIGTVRSMRMFTNRHLKQSYIAEQPVLPGTGRETRHYGTASITRASFVLSKFRLNIAAVHEYRPHPAGHYMEFSLDRACRNAVLQDAKGIWYTEKDPDGRKGYTRIWLLCELTVSRVLPTFIVDYAAKRAMPRASNWIRPAVEAMKKEFQIVDSDENDEGI